MQCYIEVTGDYQWQLRLKGKRGLNAPMSTRYKNMLYNMKKGDIILHHITTQRAEIKEHASSVVGISKTKSQMYKSGNKLQVDLEDVIAFPFPIKWSEYSQIKNPSDKFKFLLHTNLQKYILEIEKKDLQKILNLKKENITFIKQNYIYNSLL